MKPQKRAMATILLLSALALAPPAFADPTGDKLKFGMSRECLLALFGEPPQQEACKTMLGVKSCTMSWSSGVWSKTHYKVTLIGDHVVSFEVVALR